MNFEYTTIDPITHPESLKEIRTLLYNVFIVEAKWNFGKNTPSELHIEGNQLCDKFDEHCIWFVAKCNDIIVGCGRAILNAEEIKGYAQDNINLLHILQLHSPLIEINRYAVYAQYRGYSITENFMAYMLRYMSQHYPMYNLLFVPSIPRTIQALKKIGAREIYRDFKYEDNDPNTINVLVYNSRRSKL